MQLAHRTTIGYRPVAVAQFKGSRERPRPHALHLHHLRGGLPHFLNGVQVTRQQIPATAGDELVASGKHPPARPTVDREAGEHKRRARYRAGGNAALRQLRDVWQIAGLAQHDVGGCGHVGSRQWANSESGHSPQCNDASAPVPRWG